MKRLSALVAAVGCASAALANPPTATGNVASPACGEAMLLARTMFQSTAQRLYAPLLIPQDMHSRLILGASELDVSGGDALKATDAFDKLPQPNNRSVYWSRAVGKGERRIVVAEWPIGWRGDMYTLYLVDADVELSTFLDDLDASQRKANAVPIVSDSWRPPLVFQLLADGDKWFIDVGQPFKVLANWLVYSPETNQPVCTISFRTPTERPEQRLPAEVRTLATQLDEALGPGHDEGTLQPTARQRLHSKHVLANAAYRPWALSDEDAYNSRSEVDAGLNEWASANRSRRQLLGDIRETYPKAEKSLSAFYTRAFGLSEQKADEVSAWVLDLVFRSFFVFSNGGDYFRYNGVRTNPWPEQDGAPEGGSPAVQQQVPADVPASGAPPLRQGRG